MSQRGTSSGGKKHRRSRKRYLGTTLMPFGPNEGTPLADMPSDFWDYFLRHDWNEQNQSVVAKLRKYARNRIDRGGDAK